MISSTLEEFRRTHTYDEAVMVLSYSLGVGKVQNTDFHCPFEALPPLPFLAHKKTKKTRAPTRNRTWDLNQVEMNPKIESYLAEGLAMS
jgi:hypothetical protein